MRTFALLFILGFFAHAASAQSGNVVITGKVVEQQSRLSIEYVVVKLLQKRDSTLVTSVIANKAGEFKMEKQSIGNYLLQFSYIGLKTIYKQVDVTLSQQTVNMGTIGLEEGINLDGVVINGSFSVRVLKDTLEYNTGAFKTAPNANVENLLKKIVGLDVDIAGNIKVHGLGLSRVTVDGKKFFGNDYKIATKNLPADAILKIQVIDDLTEEAKQTGIDDGKREKVINLVLKADKKGGWFGSGNVAGGSGEHYLGSGNLNHFTDKMQVNFLAMSNNINQTYSSSEVGGFTGNDPGPGAVSGMVNGISYGRVSQGLSTTKSGAFNFSNSWGKKNVNALNFNYIGSNVKGKIDVLSEIQNLQESGTFYNNNQNNRIGIDESHNLEVYYAQDLDSVTHLTVAPMVSFYRNHAENVRSTTLLNGTNELINSGVQKTNRDTFKPEISGFINIRRLFKKGSVSLAVSNSYARSSGSNLNKNEAVIYSGGIATPDNLNQFQDLNNLNRQFNAKLYLKRGLSSDKKTSLVATLSTTTDHTRADQVTYDYNVISDRYEIVVPTLTSNYDNKTRKEEGEIGIIKSNSKFTFSSYMNVQKIELTGTVLSGVNDEVFRKFWAFVPRLNLSYQTESRKSFNFIVSSYITAPAITDLQPVQNNYNLLYIRNGNENLVPSKNYTTQLSFRNFNVKSSASTSLSLTYSIIVDAFSSRNVFDTQTGISYVTPINVKGDHSISLYGNYSKSTKVKGLKINLGFNAGDRKNHNYLNNTFNSTTSSSLSGNIGLNYSFKDSFFVSLNSYNTYIDVKNEIQLGARNAYFIFTNTANANLQLWKKWRLTADLNHSAYSGREDFNQQVLIINAGIQRYFMPKDQLILELKGYDLLNQNSSLTRSVVANRIESTTTVNLRRYALLKLTYKVNKMGKKK